MMAAMRGALATMCLLSACVDGEGTPDGGPDPGPDPIEEPEPLPPGTIAITLDDLEAGWLVTTTRLVATDVPDERTITSDGTDIRLLGTRTDVFFATVTDAAGRLIEARAMKGACAMASARQLHVPAAYASIQAAIDAAGPGDTVKVAPGVYTESVHLRTGVCLLGSGARSTILDAGGEGRTLVDLTDAPGSALAGFTLRGVAPRPGCISEDPFTCSGEWYSAAVYLGGSALPGWEDPTVNAPPLITNNIFELNYIGVMLYFHGVAVVRNNVFANNRNGFVANHYQDRTLLANNVFAGNTELAIGHQAASLDIVDNIITGSPIGIRFESEETGHVACNVFHANGVNSNESRFTIGADGNTVGDPGFAGVGDYRLSAQSRARDAGCHAGKVREPDGSAPDIGAFGGPLAAWADL